MNATCFAHIFTFDAKGRLEKNFSTVNNIISLPHEFLTRKTEHETLANTLKFFNESERFLSWLNQGDE